MDEQALIQQAQNGDLDAFNRLVLAYQSRVFNLAYRILGDPASAADAAQEAFISAYRGIRRFRGGSFRAWLMRIGTNACYDELRRRKRKPAMSMEEMGQALDTAEVDEEIRLHSSQEAPESAAERSELTLAIERCLQSLPPEFRIVAVLVDVQGYDYRETSQAIGKPLGTVKSRLARARSRLRDCLQKHRELLPSAYRQKNESM